jgi:hypothetical protein
MTCRYVSFSGNKAAIYYRLSSSYNAIHYLDMDFIYYYTLQNFDISIQLLDGVLIDYHNFDKEKILEKIRMIEFYS